MARTRRGRQTTTSQNSSRVGRTAGRRDSCSSGNFRIAARVQSWRRVAQDEICERFDLVSHYRERELDPDTVWKTHSTKVTYEGYLNKWILPRWENYPLVRVNAGEVELWLRSLPLARSSCAKIRNLMSVVFNHGMSYLWRSHAGCGTPLRRCTSSRIPTFLKLVRNMKPHLQPEISHVLPHACRSCVLSASKSRFIYNPDPPKHLSAAILRTIAHCIRATQTAIAATTSFKNCSHSIQIP